MLALTTPVRGTTPPTRTRIPTAFAVAQGEALREAAVVMVPT